MAKQRITLYVDSQVWKMFRLYCSLENVSASETVEGFMRITLSDTNIPEQFGSWDGWSVAPSVAEPPRESEGTAPESGER